MYFLQCSALEDVLFVGCNFFFSTETVGEFCNLVLIKQIYKAVYNDARAVKNDQKKDYRLIRSYSVSDSSISWVCYLLVDGLNKQCIPGTCWMIWNWFWFFFLLSSMEILSILGLMPKIGMLIFGIDQLLASNFLFTKFSCQPHIKLPAFAKSGLCQYTLASQILVVNQCPSSQIHNRFLFSLEAWFILPLSWITCRRDSFPH